MKKLLNKNHLNKSQRGLIRCLLKSGIYFIPFSLDGDWSFADSIKVMDINNLVNALKNNNKWNFEVSTADLEYKVYMIELYIYENLLKSELLKDFRKFESHYLKENIKDKITLYLRYSDLYQIYKAGIYKSQIWGKVIKK